MDLIGDGKQCEEVCKHAPPKKGKWPCEDCDMRWHDRADALISQYSGNIWTANTDYAEGLRDIIADVKAAPTIIPPSGGKENE